MRTERELEAEYHQLFDVGKFQEAAPVYAELLRVRAEESFRPQPETPWLKAQETARNFKQNYDEPLTEWETNPADWQHVCSARFGQARPSRGLMANWSGDSYRYDIYSRIRNENEPYKFALRWQNGGGCGWLVADNRYGREEDCLLEIIAQLPIEERRWDACHFLYETAIKTALAAARSEKDKIFQAFAEGRLTKRKNRGENTYKVSIGMRLESEAA